MWDSGADVVAGGVGDGPVGHLWRNRGATVTEPEGTCNRTGGQLQQNWGETVAVLNGILEYFRVLF